MNQRIHINIPVHDLTQSVHFYETLFGQKVSKHKTDYANFRLEQPPIHLALSTRSKPTAEKDNLHHFGVELDDHVTLNDWQQRLNTANIEYREELGTACCYAKGDKVWVNDPDNHAWELWVRTDNIDTFNESNKMQCCG